MAEQGQLPSYPSVDGAEGAGQAELFAPWWRRAVAYLLDGLLVEVAAGLVAVASGHHQLFDSLLRVHTVHGRLRPLPGSRLSFFNGLTELLAFLYALGFLSSRWRATPGMRLLRASLATEHEHDRPSVGRVAGRCAIFTGAAFLASLFPLGSLLILVDLLWPLWDARRQTIHDKLAGTVVLNGRA